MKHIIHELNNMSYLVAYPDNYDETKPCPAILFLHGAGTLGMDIHDLPNHSFLQFIEQVGNLPFCIFFPLCPESNWLDAIHLLRIMVREMVQLPRIDKKRIYLTGNSMGGYAAWQLAMSMPEYFAAVAPVCGGGMYWYAPRLADVPVWAFHGAKDEVVFPEESKKMVDAINRAGGNARLTIYPDNAHDSWTDTYTNPELYEWFLSHENNRLNI